MIPINDTVTNAVQYVRLINILDDFCIYTSRLIDYLFRHYSSVNF